MDTKRFCIIISYQNVVGNYNCKFRYYFDCFIISYQNVVGNYNRIRGWLKLKYIISYQNVVGNYNNSSAEEKNVSLYHIRM